MWSPPAAGANASPRTASYTTTAADVTSGAYHQYGHCRGHVAGRVDLDRDARR